MEPGVEVNLPVKVYSITIMLIIITYCHYHSFIAITCPVLLPPDNGRVTQLGNTPGSLAIYSCDENYQLSGESQRTCESNGQWSGVAPACQPKGEVTAYACLHGVIISITLTGINCPVLEHPERGLVSVGGNSPGSVATYSCNGGYSLLGSATRQCQSNGTWSNESPTCINGMLSPINSCLAIIYFHIYMQLDFSSMGNFMPVVAHFPYRLLGKEGLHCCV